MTAHKHAEMIEAKIYNMDLVVFFKPKDREWLKLDTNYELPAFNENLEYFICHPNHADVCLHWLNGGEVQAVFNFAWTDSLLNARWSTAHPLMNEQEEVRIKPRKEKRWIGVCNRSGETTRAYLSEGDGLYFAKAEVERKFGITKGWEFIEIEVEVEV